MTEDVEPVVRVVDKRRSGKTDEPPPIVHEEFVDTEEAHSLNEWLRRHDIDPTGMSMKDQRAKILEIQSAVLAEEPAAPEGKHCLTAFIVIVMPDGTAIAHADIAQPLVLEREAGIPDMWNAASQVARDISNADAAQRTVMFMQQASAQMAQAAVTQRVMQSPNGFRPR